MTEMSCECSHCGCFNLSEYLIVFKNGRELKCCGRCFIHGCVNTFGLTEDVESVHRL